VKVFISWSGEPSRSIARVLTKWLQSVVQQVDAWMSDEEIGSGARWSDAIAKSLGETNFGIVCVTRANQHAPWLIFEAGALAKSVEGRVVPLCIGLSFSEVTGPLAAFQGRPLDRDGVSRLVHDINAASEKPMPAEQTTTIFDAMWPRLEAAVAEAINAVPPDTEPRRSAEDMLEELVELIRRIDRNVGGDVPGTVVFTKSYVKQDSDSKRTYGQGMRGIVTYVHTDSGGEVTHVDIRLQNGEVLNEVPVDYFLA
jgi:TIR domain